MDFLTDELIFYGGLILAGVFFLSLVIGLLIFHSRYIKLQARMDQEYGSWEKKEGKRKKK